MSMPALSDGVIADARVGALYYSTMARYGIAIDMQSAAYAGINVVITSLRIRIASRGTMHLENRVSKASAAGPLSSRTGDAARNRRKYQ